MSAELRQRLRLLLRGEAALAGHLATVATTAGTAAATLATLALEHARMELELSGLIGDEGEAERQAAARILGRGLRATLAWLVDQEHALVSDYLALDLLPSLTSAGRLRLRQRWLPDAFDRFTRLDRLLLELEEEPSEERPR